MADPVCVSAEDYRSAARAASTLRTYAAGWRDFMDWCEHHQQTALPAAPATIGRYLADRALTLAPATLKHRVAAIVVAHRQAGHTLDSRHPDIADVLAGIRRIRGCAAKQKTGLTAEDIRALMAVLPSSLGGIRDRAVLLLGFAGAFRRAEVAAVRTTDLLFTSEGLVVTVRRGKEDQEGQGLIKAIPFGSDPATCPVRAVRAWLLAARLGEGPLFRRIDRAGNLFAQGLSGDAVAQIVKKAVGLAASREGWSKAEVARRQAAVAGHSLRAGFITAAAQAGVPEWAIMQHTGHKQVSTLRGYIRRGEMFATSPVKGVGL